MNCAICDLKAYLLEELDEDERARVAAHLQSCEGCREELERLRATQAVLLALPEEEVPRRIALVSAPAAPRSWWQALWAPGPRWVFASAVLIALALVARGRFEQPPTASLDTAALEQRISAEVERRLQAALQQAVAELEARQQRRLHKELAAAREQWEFQRKADLLAVEENFNVLKKRMSVLQVYLASNLEGGVR